MDEWLHTKVLERGLELRPRLNYGPVCDAQRRWDGICGLWRYISKPHLCFTFAFEGELSTTFVALSYDEMF